MILLFHSRKLLRFSLLSINWKSRRRTHTARFHPLDYRAREHRKSRGVKNGGKLFRVENHSRLLRGDTPVKSFDIKNLLSKMLFVHFSFAITPVHILFSGNFSLAGEKMRKMPNIRPRPGFYVVLKFIQRFRTVLIKSGGRTATRVGVYDHVFA